MYLFPIFKMVNVRHLGF